MEKEERMGKEEEIREVRWGLGRERTEEVMGEVEVEEATYDKNHYAKEGRDDARED